MISFLTIINSLTGFPLFPGENEQEQLSCIMEVLGVPEKYLIEKSTRKKLFFGKNYDNLMITFLSSLKIKIILNLYFIRFQRQPSPRC